MDDDTAGRTAQETTETHWTEAGELDDQDDTMTKAYKSMTRLAMRMNKAADQYAVLSNESRQAAEDLREAAEALYDDERVPTPPEPAAPSGPE